MPKLVIKQDVGTAGRNARQVKWLSLGGLLLLLITVAGAAYFSTRPVITSPVQQALALDSAQNPEVKAKYLSMHRVFNQLGVEHEKLSSQGLDDYEKNVRLLDKSGEILLHLDDMSALTDQLGLDDDEYQQLFNRHQFNKDYWQAKSHFRQLRVSRFENGGQTTVPVVEEAVISADTPKKKFQFAKPPVGMELPAGFCDLSNAASCKPEAAQAQVTEALLPLPIDDTASQPKKKFQFAKPPAGMELPAGFCDLSNSESCKPETAQAQPDELLLPLPADIPADAVTSKPKMKFQFAKPPEGMELPDGFCDLSNPASCKPEQEAMVAGDDNSNVNN